MSALVGNVCLVLVANVRSDQSARVALDVSLGGRNNDFSAMVAAFYLLLILGHLGFCDVVYYHTYRCALHRRPECQREVLWHTVRHFIYGTQFIVIANFRFHGAALLLLLTLYAADVFVAWADVWEETGSRKLLGGLPRGEYFMHIVLSVLVGCYLASVAGAVWPDRLLASGIVYQPPAVPAALRLYMTAMGIGAYAFFTFDLLRWFRFRRRTESSAMA